MWRKGVGILNERLSHLIGALFRRPRFGAGKERAGKKNSLPHGKELLQSLVFMIHTAPFFSGGKSKRIERAHSSVFLFSSVISLGIPDEHQGKQYAIGLLSMIIIRSSDRPQRLRSKKKGGGRTGARMSSCLATSRNRPKASEGFTRSPLSDPAVRQDLSD